MLNHKRSRPPYRANYSSYQVKHPSNYYRRKQQENQRVLLIQKFMNQSMICLCLLMSVLIVKKLPNVLFYEGVRSAVTGNFPFAMYEEKYQRFLLNMFPFDYAVPNSNLNEDTSTVSTAEGEVTDESGNIIDSEQSQTGATSNLNQWISKIYNQVVLDNYENGIVIQVNQDEEIKSFVSGIVLNVGVDDKISNFMNIQLENESILTVGFLENRKVSQYQHIKIGDSLGVGSILEAPGTDLGEEAFYYLSLKDKDGNYQDMMAYLEELMQS